MRADTNVETMTAEEIKPLLIKVLENYYDKNHPRNLMSQNEDQDELDQEIIEHLELEGHEEVTEEVLQEAINDFTFHIPDPEPAHLHLLKKN